MRRSTVRQKRERLEAAAAGDSTAAAAGGEEVAAGPQEEAWQEVNKKFDVFVCRLSRMCVSKLTTLRGMEAL